jgi:hypothetical protein
LLFLLCVENLLDLLALKKVGWTAALHNTVRMRLNDSLCVCRRESSLLNNISLMSTSRLLQVLLLPMEEEKNEQSRLFLFYFSDEFSCPYRSSHHKNWQFKKGK